jgi:glycosyltransferase involved in cell wall biosynthesis
MKVSPKVSIGMPVYNGEVWLQKSIESILKQTFAAFELVISDNASTDNTSEICRRFAASDSRIKYFKNDINIGANPNFNAVFRLSQGDYFKWASCNDLLDSNFLSMCVDRLDQDGECVLCYPRTKLFAEDNGPYHEYEDGCNLPQARPSERFIALLQNLKLNNIMNGLIRRRALLRTNLIENYFSSDIVLMAEISLQGKFVEIPEFLFYRRMDPRSATALMSDEEVANHYLPRNGKPMRFQQWIIHYKYFQAVLRSDIELREKASLYRYLCKNLIWARQKLARDLIESLKKTEPNQKASR